MDDNAFNARAIRHFPYPFHLRNSGDGAAKEKPPVIDGLTANFAIVTTIAPLRGKWICSFAEGIADNGVWLDILTPSVAGSAP